ncbi:MAG: methionine synthase [Candidatus Omnitrophica bacterium 4484_213]|nr:MAG: methionine synthase [Candidatus Omnitrophica bacterium 4484_213]
MLKTTTVGSLPKPDYLKRARTDFRQNRISREELKKLEKKATTEWVKIQDEIGLDVLVDGEMERGDMATYFAENLSGFKISGLVRSYGNRYYRKPIVVGKIKREKPITLEMFRFAQGLTKKPVKGMLTGPYTMADWSFNEYYPDRRSLILDLAEEIHKEAVDLEKAGAKYIQIDEPAVSTHPEEIDLAIEAMRIVTADLKVTTITHICYGDFAKIYPRMLELAVGQFDLEFANRKFELLQLIEEKGGFNDKQIGLGVIDVHSHRIETKEEVKENLRKALKVFKPGQIFVDPDCGLKTRTKEESIAKLKVMVEATEEIRKEMTNV